MPKPPRFSSQQLFPTDNNFAPEELADAGKERLLVSHGLTRETYTTERYLGTSTSHCAQELARLDLAPASWLVFEGISPSTKAYCATHGLIQLDDASAHKAHSTLLAALTETIKPLPFLYRSMAALTWRCHLVCAPEDAYDVSFSDPQIPFSVFVSVPRATSPTSSLRAAENLVHETMHLLLTQFEYESALIESEPSPLLYSPWKHELRPAQGVLHGLYVFAVLRWMWKQTLLRTSLLSVRGFAHQRVADIDEEVRAVEPLSQSTALTVTGREFVQQLLDFARQTS